MLYRDKVTTSYMTDRVTRTLLTGLLEAQGFNVVGVDEFSERKWPLLTAVTYTNKHTIYSIYAGLRYS